ncbi:MAG: ABC transporter permease [Clostridium sp.]|nr:ABC transporter permease [Clostridium sp.]MCM1209163.1 ABC transporter permease [Ruminococcus sp.]
MITFHLLKKHIQMHKSVSALLFCGIVVCIYCISVMLGIAVGQYNMLASTNTYGSITFDIGDDTSKKMDEVSEFINNFSKNGVINVIYLSRISDNLVVVGWDGTKGQNWFPLTTGRFFNEEEISDGEKSALVSDNIGNDILSNQTVDIGQASYNIIGTAWIVPWNFLTAISSNSNVHVIREDDTEWTLSFVIIPLKCYKEEFIPQQILIQFNSASYSELKKYAGEIESRYGDSKAYPPVKNSDGILYENTIKYGKMAVILCLIAELTVIRLMAEWIRLYQKEMRVLRLCGMTGLRCTFIIYGHLLLYFILGIGIAIFLHYHTFFLLKAVYGNTFPAMSKLIMLLAILFALSVIFTIPVTRKAVALGKEVTLT